MIWLVFEPWALHTPNGHLYHMNLEVDGHPGIHWLCKWFEYANDLNIIQTWILYHQKKTKKKKREKSKQAKTSVLKQDTYSLKQAGCKMHK